MRPSSPRTFQRFEAEKETFMSLDTAVSEADVAPLLEQIDRLRVGCAAAETENARLRDVVTSGWLLHVADVHNLTDLRQSETALALSRAETKEGQTNLLASATALALSREQTREGRAELLASAAALVSSRAETRGGQEDLRQSAAALAFSQGETKDGLANLMASAAINKALGLANALLVAGEAEVRKGEERFRRLVEAAPSALVMINVSGRIEMVNAQTERLFGYTRSELLGAQIEMLLPVKARGRHPGLRAGFIADPIARAMGAGPARFGLKKDGSEVAVEIELSPIVTDEGMMVLSAIVDISHRVRLEAQVLQSQKMEAVGNLTGGMAHDFNNLLGVIIGNLDLLREARPDDAEVMNLSGEALDAALRGADLTRRLLAFARRQPLQPERIDVNSLIGKAFKFLTRMLGEDIEVSLALAPDICATVADPAQLEASLTNLATNARDAMPRGGRLMIATSNTMLDLVYAAQYPDVLPGDYVMIEVTDTGAGISPQTLGHVFEPFYTTKDVDKGSGLGLSMVFGFLKQSGGHVSVYSEVGSGTTFRLYLPCAAKIDRAADKIDADAVTMMGHGERVLAVEDNAALRGIVARQLRGLGYSVIEAGTASEGIMILESERVDLLMTDIVMPGGMDGFELAQVALARWPSIKVLLTSGFPGNKFSENLRSSGLQVLIKPYRREALARLLYDILSS
jgi:PAS domain S-box-containing protein